MRPNLEHATIDNSLLKAGNKIGTIFQALSGTFTMDADMPHILSLDPGGSARTVLLPPEAKGLFFIIANTADASELLTVKEDGNSTTIATLDQDEVGMFFCSTNEAGALEWRALTPSGVGDALTLGSLTVSGATALNGNTDIGNAITDTVGFYGSTKVAQGASASQAAVVLTAVTALATTVLSEAYTGMWAFSSSTVAQTWRTRVNQLRVDVTAMNVLLTAVRKALVPTTGVGIIKGSA